MNAALEEPFTSVQLGRARRAAERLLGCGDEVRIMEMLRRGEPVIGGSYVLRKPIIVTKDMPSVVIRGAYFRVCGPGPAVLYNDVAVHPSYITGCQFVMEYP
jgi:hypothetical protein